MVLDQEVKASSLDKNLVSKLESVCRPRNHRMNGKLGLQAP